MSPLMTFSEYAATLGVNVSTISRAVTKGALPVVTLADGRRLIDRAAADSARRKNENICRGHGGRPDRALRRQATWRAKDSTGFDPALLAALNVMRARWPLLICKAMNLLGAAEIDQARAVLSLQELIDYLAAMTHDDFNRGHVRDYSQVVAPKPEVVWTDTAAQEFFERWGDTADGTGARWTSDDDGIDGVSNLIDEFLDAGLAAKP